MITNSFQDFTFPKSEKLVSEKTIKELFSNGSSFALYPFKIIFLANSDKKNPIQTLIIAPKKAFKKAVDRNKIKRLTREAYRLNKHILTDTIQLESICIAFIYIGKEIHSYPTFEKAIKKALSRIANPTT